MSEKLKNIGLKFIMVSVYIVSYIFLTLELVQNNSKLDTILVQAKERLNISQSSFVFFVVIVMIPFVLLMLLITYLLIKILFRFFYKEDDETSYNDQIFVSLLLTNIVVNTLSLFLINVLSVSLITGVTPILDCVLFISLFYSSSKNFRAAKSLAIAKLVLLAANYIISLVFS